jgi:hypothetical protein
LIDEVADLGEAHDLRQQFFSFRLGEAHQRGVHEDVFDPGELRIEAGAELEQRRDAPVVMDATVRRFERAGDDLQQCRLAGSVWSDDAGRCALPRRRN